LLAVDRSRKGVLIRPKHSYTMMAMMVVANILLESCLLFASVCKPSARCDRQPINPRDESSTTPNSETATQLNNLLNEGSASRIRILAGLAVVAILLVSLLAILEFEQASSLQSENEALSKSISSLKSQNQNLTSVMTSISGNEPAEAEAAFLVHLSDLDTRNVTLALLDYAPNATMIYSGTTLGIGGTYNGSANIKYTLETFIGGDKSLNFTSTSVKANRIAFEAVDLMSNITFTGSSSILGNFNGTVVASYSYSLQQGRWVILQEDWNFTSYQSQFSLYGI